MMDEASGSNAGSRPGCVTAYVVLAAIGVLGAIFWIALSLTLKNPGLTNSLAAYILVISAVNLAIIVGLWRMRNWARALVMVSQGLSILAELLWLFRVTGSGSENPFAPIGSLIGIGVSGYIVWWFHKNRQRFA